jgi:hypothetical protein
VSAFEAIQVRPLDEAELDFAIDAAGGARAHPDADKRPNVGADYKLGSTLIELKGLDEEGLSKLPRQKKLADLFQRYEPQRPVIVLDRQRLEAGDQARFDRIIEGPIKTAISTANRQLKQSRREHGDSKCSVLMVVNNGYTSLDHEALKALVTHRVRQDTHEIDAVVVAGAYYHSDGFDTIFLWPIDCVPMNLDRPFIEFERLRDGWNALAERFMTRMMIGDPGPKLSKGPVADTQFEHNGVTFIRPAPVFGAPSEFYVHGRPRNDSSGLSACPPVGRTFPSLTLGEWTRLEKSIARPSDLLGSYETWKRTEMQGFAESDPLKPFVTIPVTAGAYEAWLSQAPGPNSSIFQFANALFSDRIRELIGQARDLEQTNVVPSRYVLATTDVVGQDRANDVSQIAAVQERSDGKAMRREFLADKRMFHEHALALAAAYAIRERLDSVMWVKNLRYAWI